MPVRARHSFTTTEQDVARHLWTKPAHNECSGQSEQLSLARLKQGSSNEGLGRGAGEKGGGGGRREGEGRGEAIGSTFLLIGLEAVGLPTHHFMLKRHQRKKGKTSIWAATCGFYIILLWPSSAITF